ncbi:MAG: hypothetical protein L3J54_02800, partial [Draconibacterium sp.]|nr:hypothetical protein [Draconibacterium sp.]
SGADLFNVAFAPEKNAKYSVWKKMPIGVDGFEADFANLQKYFDVQNSVAYLKTEVWIEKVQIVTFEIGSDDGVKVWVNNKLIHQNNQERGHEKGQDKVEFELNTGWNTVLMKINQGTGGWGASLAISGLEQELISGLKYR